MTLDTILSAGGLLLSGLNYNRDGYSDNVQLRQNQIYQEKNYYITWIAAVREEVRDIMTIFVGRMSNYNVVSTLVAAIVAGSICEGEPAASCPDFVVHAFYFSMYLSGMYLFLAVLYATRGMTVAYNSSMAFLVAVVPDPLDKYDHDYMQQVTKNFERDLRQVFRPPLWNLLSGMMNNNEGGESNRSPGVCKRRKFAGRPVRDTGLERLPRGGDPARTTSNIGGSPSSRMMGHSLSGDSDVRISSSSYFESLRLYSELWEPFATSAEEALAHGILCLAHGSVYYCLARLHDRSLRWAAITVLGMFVIIAAVMFCDGGVSGALVREATVGRKNEDLLKGSEKRREAAPCWELMILVLAIAGPLSSCIADRASVPWIDDLFVPLSYMFHSFLAATFSVYSFRCSSNCKGNWLPQLDPAAKYLASIPELGGYPEFARDKAELFEAPVFPKLAERSISSVSKASASTTASTSASEEPMKGAECLAGLAGATGVTTCRVPGKMQMPAAPTMEARKDPEELLLDLLYQSRKEIRTNMQMLRLSTGLVHAIACLAWVSVFVWSIYVRLSSMEVFGPFTEIEEVAVQWPSPYFRPTGIACAGGHTYVSDRFAVYELAEGTLHPFQCNVSKTLSGAAAVCNSSSCWPVALSGASVVDCSAGGQEHPLLQTTGVPEHLATLGSGELAVLHGSELLEYHWSTDLQGFRPQWPLADVKPDDLRAMDIVEDPDGGGRRLVLFRAAMTISEGRHADRMRRSATVEVESLLPAQGAPVLPPYQLMLRRSLPALRGGCVLDDHTMMVLLQGESGPPTLGRLRANVTTGAPA